MNAQPSTRPAADLQMLDVQDPATDEVVGRVPILGPAAVEDGIERVREAQPSWAAREAADRAAIVAGIGRTLRSHRAELSRLITAEQGKPLREAGAEVDYAADFFQVAAREVGALAEEPVEVPGKSIRVEWRPIGTTAAITPWNFPLAMLAKKAASALVVGCGQVVKPAEQTPLSAVRFAELAREAGLPEGLLRIVTGQPQEIGETLLRNASIRKLSFTGSTETGRLLMAGAASSIMPLSLELGGHAPLIVFDDASLEAAVEMTMVAKFRNAGQTCIAPNRILVQAGIHDRYVDRLAARSSELRSGHGRDEVDLGPLIDDAAVEKVAAHVEDARERGGRIVLGGGRRSIPGLSDRFPEPTIVIDTDPRMRCWREETFGPVCPIRRFETEAEAISLANATPYGLAGYVATGDAARGRRVARALECGIVGVNDARPAIAEVPFGGVKQSGFGREGGRLGLDDFLVPVTISRIH